MLKVRKFPKNSNNEKCYENLASMELVRPCLFFALSAKHQKIFFILFLLFVSFSLNIFLIVVLVYFISLRSHIESQSFALNRSFFVWMVWVFCISLVKRYSREKLNTYSHAVIVKWIFMMGLLSFFFFPFLTYVL